MADRSSDVLVVGGGPAGLATALAVRLRGARVTVADARVPPIDKACGEGLMPDSLADLTRLGVDIRPEDGAKFRGIRFVNHGQSGGGNVATACFPALACAAHSVNGIGVRRQVLHGRLVEAAVRAGVELRWGCPVQLKEDGRVLAGGEPAQFKWLVGADGLGSQVRRWAGLERGSEISRRFGFRKHFRVAPWSEFVEVHWGPSGQAYVTPTGTNEICVAGVVRDPHRRLETLLAELPGLLEKLSGVEGLDRERGSVTLTRRLRRVASGRVALVGDASGSADAITGEGMGLSFRQALLLAECLETGDLYRYNRMHSTTLKLAQTMARVMLLMDGSERFRDRAIGMLAERPEIFARLLGVHLGVESIRQFVAAKGFEVTWRLVAGRGASIVGADLAGTEL